ncbi:hypothetical protein Pcinc_038064 [Petrolisthes cinctipes]|uniref:Fibronectin type-III domain-containing protein n=1 Tax=Petrolisthes cinctipes TaxID=88211 RepID=A0AAE1BSV6_PETCI|nr:hypothetical protein Pcinc_038064 [Petrolisthes cinctipes]
MYGNTDYTCVTTPTTNVTLSPLEACTLYHVNVYSVSSFGALSPELKMDTNTDEAAPGAPENLRITNQTANWVALAWDDPLDRANCVDAWKITYGETNSPPPTLRQLQQKGLKKEKDIVRVGGVGGVGGLVRDDPIITSDNFATISPLRACTNMTFWVSGVSPSGITGSTRITQTTMEETEPTPVSSVEAVPLNQNSLLVVWTPGKPTPVSSVEAVPLNQNSLLVVWTPGSDEECVTEYHVCVTDIVDLDQACVDTDTIEQTFNGLEACVNYDVTVTPISPSGVFGDPAFDIANTGDLPTSEPTNLRVTEVTSHTAIIKYGPPEMNPRCVTEFNTQLLEQGKSTMYMTSLTTHLEEMVSGLGSCSLYEYRIRAVTASGFVSGWASVNFTTAEDTPSSPRSLSHLTLTSDSVQLRWFVPETNPWCADVYRINWTSTVGDNGTRDITVPNHPPEVVENIDGLTGCTDYTFSVSAVTTLGTEGPPATHNTTTTC